MCMPRAAVGGQGVVRTLLDQPQGPWPLQGSPSLLKSGSRKAGGAMAPLGLCCPRCTQLTGRALLTQGGIVSHSLLASRCPAEASLSACCVCLPCPP